VSKSGTSTATARVAGAAAILAAQHPDWSGDVIKSALVATAAPVGGRLDIARAIASPIQVAPASVSADLKWPETEPRKNTVTYRNTSSAPVTLSLAFSLQDAAGQAAPAALAKLSESALTVAAGAEAAVTMTTTPRSGRPGQYAGSIVATTVDGRYVRTPVSVRAEPEEYDLTVSMLDREGNTVTDAFLVAVDQATAERIPMKPETPIRLPGGKYTIMAEFDGPSGYTVRLAQPVVDLRRDTTVEFDGRQARRVSVRTDQPELTGGIWQTGMWMKVADGLDRFGLGGFFDPSGSEVYTYSPGNVTSPLFTYFDAYRLSDPDDKHRYELSFPLRGRIPTSVEYSVRSADLAAVTARYYGQTAEAPPYPGARRLDFDVPVGLTFFVPTSPSKQRVEYFTPGQWQLTVGTARDGTRHHDITLAAGGAYQVDWNRAVLSPGFNGTTSSELGTDHPWAFRKGGIMSVAVPAYTDAAGHSAVPDIESGTTTGTTSLYSGDRLIGTQNTPGRGLFWIGQVDEEFRLATEVNRDESWWPLSTKVSSEWTFTARFRQGPSYVPLPLLTVRAEPPVDLTNRAPSGSVSIPLTVSRQDQPAQITDVTVDYSVDDGATWQPAAVSNGKATVTNPTNGFVSLRTKASDIDGNSGTTTVIRAYQVG
jgi:hypothetical protein